MNATGARPRLALVLAGVLWLGTVAGVAVVPAMDRAFAAIGRSDLAPGGAFAIPPSIAAVTAATIGFVVTARRSRHPVGWLLLLFGLSLGVSGDFAGYLSYGLVARPGSLPATGLLARYYLWTVFAAFTCLAFIMLLTPAGSLPSPRWRWWARLTGAVPVIYALVVPFLPGRFDAVAQALAGPIDPKPAGGAMLFAGQGALALSLLAVAVAAVSLTWRVRRATGIERQQLRWVALAAVLTGVALLLVGWLILLGAQDAAGWVAVTCLVFPPLAIGAAILRFRLYDVDRIISRTLGYALVTVLLAAFYAAVVLGFGQIAGRDNTLLVAGATLAVAAAFQPLRRRVQQWVDRRFDRRRYDAALTVAAFSTRLRDEVDLGALTGELLQVVDRTTQPTRVSLWLRPSARPPR
jgi:hypothetical protein